MPNSKSEWITLAKMHSIAAVRNEKSGNPLNAAWHRVDRDYCIRQARQYHQPEKHQC